MKNLLFTFIPNYKRPNILRKNTIHNTVNPINGADIGIPLNILQNIFTNLHYGYDITTVKIVVLQFLIGYYTYGKDRYKDALEYNEAPYQTKKEELYQFLVKYKDIYKLSYCITFIAIASILLFDENSINNIPFLILLYSSEYYKQLKLKYPILKPIYISIMWTMATVILPCVLYDNNYSILEHPLDYLPCMLELFATSNLADVRDIEEDKINGINTLPVKYGAEFTYMITLLCLFLSSLLFGLNHNYLLRPFANSFFEIQNAGLSFLPFILSNSTLPIIKF